MNINTINLSIENIKKNIDNLERLQESLYPDNKSDVEIFTVLSRIIKEHKNTLFEIYNLKESLEL